MSKESLTDYVHLGACKKVHGIKGAFKFFYFNSESKSLKQNHSIIVVKNGKHSEYEVESISGKDREVVKLKGIDTRNDSEALVSFDFYLHKKYLPKTNSGEHYYIDLEDLEVVENDAVIGKVVEVYDHGANAILSIKLKDNQIIDIPKIDQFVKKIDLENKKVHVSMPEFIGEKE